MQMEYVLSALPVGRRTLIFPLKQQLLLWASDNTLSINGRRSLNNKHTHSEKNNTLFIHRITPTHSAATPELRGYLCPKTLNHSVELPSPKWPILSNTFLVFPHIPPPLPLLPSLCSPATILSCSRSHRSLASAQSLEQGAQFGRQGLRHVWQCFSRPLYRKWLKRSQGCICCSVQEEISVKVGYSDHTRN